MPILSELLFQMKFQKYISYSIIFFFGCHILYNDYAYLFDNYIYNFIFPYKNLEDISQ